MTDARVQFGNTAGTPEVSMAMNGEGAGIWARLTGDNIGKHIAIVLDGMVYSYPRVNGKIEGGNSSITGDFTIEEADLEINSSGSVDAGIQRINQFLTVINPVRVQSAVCKIDTA